MSHGSPRSPCPSPGPEERLVPAEHLEHDGYAAPLEAAERGHHLRGRGEVVRRVDGQEDRVRALLVRRPQRHAGPDPELARLVRRRRDHRALVDDPAPTDHDRLAGQLRLAQDLDRRQEHVEVDVQHPPGHAGPLRGRRQRVGRLQLVETGEQQQVGDHRPDLREQHVGVEVGGALDPAGRVADREQGGPRGDGHPVGHQLAGHHVGGVGQVAAEPGVGRGHRPAAVRRDRRPPDQDAGAAQRAVDRVDQVDHPSHAGLVADPERRGGDDGQPLVGRGAQLGDVVVGRPRVGEQLERVVDLALVHHVAGRAQQLGHLADHARRLLARSPQRRGRDDGGRHAGPPGRRSPRRSTGSGRRRGRGPGSRPRSTAPPPAS